MKSPTPTIKQVMTPPQTGSNQIGATSIKTVTPGSGQPIQSFQPKVEQPDIAKSPPLKQQIGESEQVAYDFTSLGYGVVTCPQGDFGISLVVPSNLKCRKIGFGGYVAGITQFNFNGFVILLRNKAVIARLPFFDTIFGVGASNTALNPAPQPQTGVFAHVLSWSNSNLNYCLMQSNPGGPDAAFTNMSNVKDGVVVALPFAIYNLMQGGYAFSDILLPKMIIAECDEIRVVSNNPGPSPVAFVLTCESSNNVSA